MADEPQTTDPAATAEPAKTEPAKTAEPSKTEPPKTEPSKDPQQDALGDAGKAAIAAERKRASTAEKALKEAQAQLAEIAKSNMSEQEKAIAKAREEASTEVASRYEQQIRANGLKLAVMGIAIGSGVTVGDGDKARTVKFADADDVQMWVERQIATGGLDADDIYSQDGQVNGPALTKALTSLASNKPGWLADAPARTTVPRVDFDAGKGNGGSGHESDMNSLIRGSRGG